MSSTATITAATTAIIIQGIQAWIAMARQSGMDETQINELFVSTLGLFNNYRPASLPDAEEGK